MCSVMTKTPFRANNCVPLSLGMTKCAGQTKTWTCWVQTPLQHPRSARTRPPALPLRCMYHSKPIVPCGQHPKGGWGQVKVIPRPSLARVGQSWPPGARIAAILSSAAAGARGVQGDWCRKVGTQALLQKGTWHVKRDARSLGCKGAPAQGNASHAAHWHGAVVGHCRTWAAPLLGLREAMTETGVRKASRVGRRGRKWMARRTRHAGTKGAIVRGWPLGSEGQRGASAPEGRDSRFATSANRSRRGSRLRGGLAVPQA